MHVWFRSSRSGYHCLASLLELFETICAPHCFFGDPRLQLTNCHCKARNSVLEVSLQFRDRALANSDSRKKVIYPRDRLQRFRTRAAHVYMPPLSRSSDIAFDRCLTGRGIRLGSDKEAITPRMALCVQFIRFATQNFGCSGAFPDHSQTVLRAEVQLIADGGETLRQKELRGFGFSFRFNHQLTQRSNAEGKLQLSAGLRSTSSRHRRRWI